MAPYNDSAQGNSSTQPLEKVLAMTTGGGKDSYSKNSQAQAFMVNKFCLPYLAKALELVSLPAQKTMVVADLGCSSGPNTIGHVSYIVDKLRGRYTDAGSPPPDFQAFCNDLPSNDFNHLFQLLSSDPRTSNLFVGGVPGSLYGRLFPRSSVNVFFGSNCLNWLSKIPDAVLDKDSAAYNKDRLWVSGSTLATAAAYREQALSDLRLFLKARAEEIVSGGLLFVVFPGRPDSEPNKLGHPSAHKLWDTLDDVWSELISEGVFTEEQRAAFNIPLFFRSPEDVQEALGSCTSDFDVQTVTCHVESLRITEIFPGPGLSRKIVGMFKSILTSLVQAHVGNELGEVFWKRLQERVDKDLAHHIPSDEVEGPTSWTNVVSLLRK